MLKAPRPLPLLFLTMLATLVALICETRAQVTWKFTDDVTSNEKEHHDALLFSETENTTNEFSFKQLEANLQPKNIYKNDISHERKLNAELRWISKEEEIQAYHQKQNAAPQEHNIILGITSGYSLVIIDGRDQQSKEKLSSHL